MEEFVGNLDTVHHIQRGILSKLTYNLRQTHTELLPDGMSGNSFNYHLNYLLKQKIIKRDEEGYTLTPLGRLVTDSMSLTEKRFRLRPTSGLLLHVTEQSSRKLMVFESNRQPLFGYTGLPFGKLRVGEAYRQTAERMLERRGLSLNSISCLTKRTSFNIRYTEDGELVAHRTGEIWQAEYAGELIEAKTKNGRSYWVSTDILNPELSKVGKVSDLEIRL